ncbi:MAG: NAD(P)-binding domain-containing protein [Crocinitomicaceae bacterium]
MNWTIIGCGWLGTSLAETLLNSGDDVIGTTTRPEKKSELEQKGIKSVTFKLNSQISTEIIGFSEIVVLSVPPFNRTNTTDYGDALVNLVQQFHPNTKFLFLGSTGIYPQKNGVYTEEYDFKIEERNNSLFKAEEKLTEALSSRLTILRLGGLFGEDRHPIYQLSGRANIANPKGKINFAGKNDIISILNKIVQLNQFGEIFNIVFPEHPTRESYYYLKAKEFNLIPPSFNFSPSIIREISSKKVQSILHFKFQHSI